MMSLFKPLKIPPKNYPVRKIFFPKWVLIFIQLGTLIALFPKCKFLRLNDGKMSKRSPCNHRCMGHLWAQNFQIIEPENLDKRIYWSLFVKGYKNRKRWVLDGFTALFMVVWMLLFFSPPEENSSARLHWVFYGMSSISNYLKIEMLLAIAATATIATAIIVIVSIKQSPFFNQLIILFNV